MKYNFTQKHNVINNMNSVESDSQQQLTGNCRAAFRKVNEFLTTASKGGSHLMGIWGPVDGTCVRSIHDLLAQRGSGFSFDLATKSGGNHRQYLSVEIWENKPETV